MASMPHPSMLESEAVARLLEALKVGISQDIISKVKAAPVPHNILFDIGSERNPSFVNLGHVKANASLLIEIGKRFPSSIPNKVICRTALAALDDEHRYTLSKTRTRIYKGEVLAIKTDQFRWAQENGNNLSKILSWPKATNGETSNGVGR